MKNEQTVTFEHPNNHIEMIRLMAEPGEPFRILLEAPNGGYFGTIFLSASEMESIRDAIDIVLKG